MPPAPTSRASRPSSIYSSGPASSSKKRSSVSPADPSQMQPQAIKPVVKKHASPGKARVLTAAIHNQQKLNVVPAPSKSRSTRNQNRLLYEDEYHDEVTAYMHTMETTTLASAELMDMQPELQWYMRPFLVDFLIEIHHQFRLRPEVLYLAMNIVDRYVSKRVVYKKHYQLVGCAALWIAAKFEDAKDRVPTVRELADMCCKAYDETAFIQMEGHVLQTIGWTIGHPTAEAWMRMACIGNDKEDTKTQHIARFLMEITLFHREFVGIKPSVLAAGSLMIARFICGLPRHPVHRDEEDIIKVARLLDICLGEHLKEVSQIVVDKYAPVYFSRASIVVREWYQSGRRWVYISMPPPISPASSLTAPGLISSWSSRRFDINSSPNSVTNSSCASSEAGDDMPRTPITPGYGMTDPFNDANMIAVATAAGISVPHMSIPVVIDPHHHHQHQKENIVPKAYHANMASHHKSVMVPNMHAATQQYAVPVQRHALHPVQQTASAIPKALRRLSG
ncbi:hypothetical protein QFC20_001731 [Naganishia adeliensis]|uniref:Uncharacterized protein n=1 Tax=Naganishia adeliensis TaxID=92952 RepID=A0ACC2WPL1_9TREE|nr:hypothetical protein QFC20_001731 [Naganishia adeliensis]